MRHLLWACGIAVVALLLNVQFSANAQLLEAEDLVKHPHLKAWSNIIPNASRRFVLLTDFSNQAVLDRETGLVWERSPGTLRWTWGRAGEKCIDKVTGGRKGWRLPSIIELMSLIDPVSGAPFPPGHPFTEVGGTYWSATSSAADASLAWVMFSVSGEATTFTKTSLTSFGIWCVRGGITADAY
jgi:hypothetical protein